MHSPARVFLAFVLVMVGAMLFAAVASPWVQALLGPVDEIPLHRVFSRLALLGMIAGTAWLVTRRQFAAPGLLGFHPPWPRFGRRLLLGLLAGIALMLLALAPLFLLGVREWNDRVPAAPGGWLTLILKGLLSGIVVALLEETFFRGALQGALQRRGATLWALFAVPALYSFVHFLGREAGQPAADFQAWSGFVTWMQFFSTLARPLGILDAFVALYCVGLLLALVRWRWGDLAGCIGLHAGFVTVIAVARRISAPATEGDWSFLAGSFDGLLGWWIAAVSALCCLVLWRVSRGAVATGGRE